MAATSTRPFRIRAKREGDTGERSFIVGYYGTCECGRKTPKLSSVQAVRAWKQVHKARGHRD